LDYVQRKYDIKLDRYANQKGDLPTTGSTWYERSEISDMASVSLLNVGTDSSDTLSSSGSSKGERSMRCVREEIGGAGIRTLLLREVDARLVGGRLLARYGGGGSSRLLPSAKGSRSTIKLILWLLAEVIDTRSDVSIPVKYAPLVPDVMGPKMTGCEELAVGGWLDDGE
jgi:hypothetical protein